MANQDPQTIVANFNSVALADGAAKFLTAWDKSRSDIKLVSLSLVCETDDGELKVKRYGTRNTVQGAVMGVILGLLVSRAVGVSAPLGMLLGAVVGGAAGTLSMQQPDLSSDEHDALLKDLKRGRAALVIRLAGGEVSEVAAEIARLDGEVKEYDSLGQRVRLAAEPPATAPA